jgi:hypothetical protein
VSEDKNPRNEAVDVLVEILNNPNSFYSPGVELAQLEACETILANVGPGDKRRKPAEEFLLKVTTAGGSITSRVRAAKILLAQRAS